MINAKNREENKEIISSGMEDGEQKVKLPQIIRSEGQEGAGDEDDLMELYKILNDEKQAQT